jgi:hypothetical protein
MWTESLIDRIALLLIDVHPGIISEIVRQIGNKVEISF